MKSEYIICAGILIISVFIFITHNGAGPMLGDLDVAMFYAINHINNPLLKDMAATASDVGSKDSNILMLMFILISFMFFVSMIKQEQEIKRLALILIISIVISGMLVDPLKSMFGVERPYVKLKGVNVHSGGEWINEKMLTWQNFENNSFPSGHAMITFTALGVLWEYRRLRILLFIFLLTAMFFIVYVGQHYVSDIIVGGTIGYLVGYLSRKTFDKLGI